MAIDKKAAIIIGSAMAFGFLADVVQYSMGKSEKGKFRFHFPSASNLRTILVIVLIEAVAIDYTLAKMEAVLASDEENKLRELAKAEAEKIKSIPDVDKKIPASVLWIPKMI